MYDWSSSTGVDVETGTGAATVGTGRLRHEDPRLLTGMACYSPDLRIPGLAHTMVVRSPVARGRLRAVGLNGELPGDVTLVTAAEVAATFPCRVPVLWRLGDQTQMVTRVADRELRYVGQPVAVLVGPTPEAVADAVELVEVDVEELPAAVSVAAATAPGAPLVQADQPDNVLARFAVGDDRAGVEAVLATCRHQLTSRFRIGRIAGAPMEGRGIMVEPRSGGVTIHTSTQAPHAVRDTVSAVLGLPLDQIRVAAPDVGGGFGVKDHAHDDELLVVAAAVLLQRPLTWSESRSESLTVTTQARDETHEVTVGFDHDGRLRALWVDAVRNAGAHFAIFGGGPLFTCLGMLPGPYTWEAYGGAGTLVATNQVPTAAYRGFGQTQACFVRERVVDLVAAELALDPVEIRRRNLVTPAQQPWTLRSGVTFDNGDYHQPLELAGDLAATWPEPPDDGRRWGVGYATYVQMAGIGPSDANAALGLTIGGYESASVTMLRDGSVRLAVGTCPQGQGHETAYAQLVADRLGLNPATVTLAPSDTAISPYSVYGTAASRSITVGGGAAVRAANELAGELRALAAHRLEANPADLDLAGGRVRVRGGAGVDGVDAVPIADLAAWSWLGAGLPEGLTPGLVAHSSYDPASSTFSFGTHVCRVAIDPATGAATIDRYGVVQDCGTIVNPMIVEGQIHGGVAQGAGATLLEEVVVGVTGDQMTSSFLDYLIPGSGFLPPIEIRHTITPSPHTPGGMKGTGEGATNGAFVCVANAVAAALPEVTSQLTETPFTPQRIWRLLQDHVTPGRT